MTGPNSANGRADRNWFWRTARATGRIAVTLGVAALSVVAVGLGSAELSRRADAAPAPEPAAILPVQTAPIRLSPGYEVTRSFVGQIEARRAVPVSFELSGRLTEILVDEGDTVEMGQRIASLDTRLLRTEQDRLEASRAALEAQLRFAEQTVERQSRLSDRGFASQAALDEASARMDELRARIAEIAAALQSNALQIEKSQVYSPFAGRIAERMVDGGESMAPGQPVLRIVESGDPHLRVGVPLDITVSDLEAASVEIDGTRHQIRLITLRPDIDPETRTRTAIFEVTGAEGLAFGQTARLTVTDTVTSPGIWVPVATLKEGQRGQWTLLAVDAEHVVRALSVQVLHTQGDRVFVRGAFPDNAQLITSGPQRITVGQTVVPQPAS